MGDQVLVESHLRWCQICAARVEDLQVIGARRCARCPHARRVGARSVDDEPRAGRHAVRRAARTRTSSTSSRSRCACASCSPTCACCGRRSAPACAVVLCLAWRAACCTATSDEQPDVAGGDDRDRWPTRAPIANPLRLDGGDVRAARARRRRRSTTRCCADDEARRTTLSRRVVTREGRDWRTTSCCGQSGRRRSARDRHGRQQRRWQRVLDAVEQSRFEPAQAPAARRWR